MHGVDISTQILLMTENKEEIKETGIFFSKLFGIVESKEWANLTEECGTGGNLFKPANIEKMTQTKQIRYGNKWFNNREKSVQTLMTEHNVINVSQLTTVKAKIKEKLSGVPKTETHKKSMREAQKNPETKRKHSQATKRARFNQTPERRKEISALGGAGNKGNIQSEEWINKRIKRKTYKYNGILIRNAEEFCKKNKYSYGMFLTAAREGRPYKGHLVEYIKF